MKRFVSLLLLLAIAGSSGCLSRKLNGFQEIVTANPRGLEHCVGTDEGAALIESLGLYINKLEEELEKD